MGYRNMLCLQKCLYINIYTYVIWAITVAFFLYIKVDKLGHLTKYLSLTVFALLVVIESFKLYLGHYGNLLCRVGASDIWVPLSEPALVACQVPELAGFLMLTMLMQLPLVSFFLFNPYLLSTPTEITLHTILWLLSCSEIGFSYLALKQASALAKSIYLSPKDNSK